MKIVCDACQAKYSISDDKVQGKVFKIRCKKCSNIIVVRGGAGAEQAPAPVQEKETRVYDYGYEGGEQPADDAVWHVVINSDQVGPMSAGEVQQRFSAGEIDAETYIWREGFADWLPLVQVDVFAALAAGGGGGGGHQAVASMFGGGGEEMGTVRSDPGDLFASAGGAARHHEEDDGGDLFGAKPAQAQQQAAAGNAKLRGERNENSVLFSLNNLAQLASDKPAPVQSAPSGHATGAAGGEGSGLIDIRSMASAYLGGSGAPASKAATSSAIGSIDDLPVFGGGGFSEPAVIVPSASRGRDNKMLYIMIAAVGMLAVVAVILIVVLLKGNKTPPPTLATNEKPTASADTATGSDKPATPETGSAATPPPATGSAEPPATGSATVVASNTPPTNHTAAPTPAENTPPKETPPRNTPPPSHREPTVARAPSHREPVARNTTPKESAPKDTGGSCDEVSCVLNNYEGACCAKFKKGGGPSRSPTTARSGGGDLPDALDRQMISDGIARVKGRALACGDRSSAKGRVKVHVKVDGNGRVSNVSVESSPDPGLGACVAGAVRGASFAKTQNGGSFGYPFMF